MRFGSLLLLLATTACVPKTVAGAEGQVSWAQAAVVLGNEVVGPSPFVPQAFFDKPVLVTFLASWCFPCLTDLKALRRLHDDYAGHGLQLVFVGMDVEGAQTLAPFAANSDLRGPLLVASPSLRSGDSVFGAVRMLPARVLFGRDGQARGASGGPLDYPATDIAIRAALGATDRP
jgi:thiol-disulfide isomerase/thioredoxin